MKAKPNERFIFIRHQQQTNPKKSSTGFEYAASLLCECMHNLCGTTHNLQSVAPQQQTCTKHASSRLWRKEDPPSPSRTSFYLRSARDCAPFYKNVEFSGSTSPLVAQSQKPTKIELLKSNQVYLLQLNWMDLLVGWCGWLVGLVLGSSVLRRFLEPQADFERTGHRPTDWLTDRMISFNICRCCWTRLDWRWQWSREVETSCCLL